MFWGIVFFSLNIAIILYVIISLSSIKFKLNLIMKHLSIKEEEETDLVTNEEIEKELEENDKGI